MAIYSDSWQLQRRTAADMGTLRPEGGTPPPSPTLVAGPQVTGRATLPTWGVAEPTFAVAVSRLRGLWWAEGGVPSSERLK